MTPDPQVPSSDPAVAPPGSTADSSKTVPASTQDEEKARLLSTRSDALSPRVPAMSPTLDYVSNRHDGDAPSVPGYRLLRELGRGTYGEVWLAEEANTGSQVAIKFLITSVGEQWKSLQAEVRQLAALLDDPGIVQLKEFRPDAAKPYYVMAYAEGGSLAKRLRDEGPIPLSEALSMFSRIAEAMAYVHAKGIRHCDLKPGNILIDKRGRPRVADFGQAHLASDMSPALGTFFYMAPEQAHIVPQEADARWDVYALGALFYAMLTGGPPHGDSSLKQELTKTESLPERLKIYRQAMDRAKPLVGHRRVPGMDKPLAHIIEQCLALDPARRFRSAEAVVAALKRRAESIRQKTILYAGLVVPVLLVLILGALAWWQISHTLDESEKNLEKQAMKSYTNSAVLAGAKVKDTVEYYMKGLITARLDPALKIALQDPQLRVDPKKNNGEINALLQNFSNANPPPLNVEDNPVIFWLVLDKHGNMVGCRTSDGIEQKYIGWNYAYRGYFHGGADDLEASKKQKERRRPGRKDSVAVDREGKEYEPITKPLHISNPFMSTDGHLSIGLSTPIKDDQDQTIGLLLVGLKLEELSNWLAGIDFEHNGFPVLIDENAHVLVHKKRNDDWAKDGKMPPTYGGACPLYSRIINSEGTDLKKGGADYLHDPIMDDEYLAGFVAIQFKEPTTGYKLTQQKWGLLVQVKRDKVLAPARSARHDMIQWGLIMVSVAITMLVVMWLALLRMLRGKERLTSGTV